MRRDAVAGLAGERSAGPGPGDRTAGGQQADHRVLRLPQEAEPGDLSAVGCEQALPGQRGLLRVPRRREDGPGRLPALQPDDRDPGDTQGLLSLPLEGSHRVHRVASREGRSHSRFAGQRPGRHRRRQQGHAHDGLPGRRVGGGRERLLAMPRLADQDPARRQTGPGDLPQQRNRTAQPGRLRGVVQRLSRAPRVLRRPGPAPGHLRQVPSRTRSPAEGDLRGVQAPPAASATSAPIIRRRRSTRSPSTASRSSATSTK